MASLRIGTWNLGRSGAFHRTRIPGQLAVLRRLDVDLWILTDGHAANVPAQGHACRAVPGVEFQHAGEHRVIVWSRHALEPVVTEDPTSTVAVRLHPPALDRPVLVYGTAMTHARGGAVQRQGLAWQRHHATVQRQRAEWLRLRQEYADHLLCVAGDFNASLDTAAHYGTVDPRQAILQGLADAGLKCLTAAERLEVHAQAHDGRRASVDHVAFTDVPGLNVRLETVPGVVDGHRMSERDGVVVELSWA
ncbi:endonuclease/exonuclease/phosphatase family protein [Azohydromonas aeria]|uniref:endonuclease/exonuclease/phosphatase family protein n=1 Tax=Azohydromonas aeria TaxID=2590212 RepID=UPI0012F9B7D3|nr:endonuclease/exonuclease/phosphatase family protein [Azohydromonas aeria]